MRNILIFSFFILLSSCINNNRTKIVKKTQKDFNENLNQYSFLADYMLKNKDGVISIHVNRKNEILFKTKESIKMNVLPLKMLIINEYSNYIKDTGNFEKVIKIIKKRGIISIYKNDNKVEIGYKNRRSPCFNLIFRYDNFSKEKWFKDLINNFKNSDSLDWAYQINDNWYIKRSKCF